MSKRFDLGGRLWLPTEEQVDALNKAIAEEWTPAISHARSHASHLHTSFGALGFAAFLRDYAAKHWVCEDCKASGKTQPCGCGLVDLHDDETRRRLTDSLALLK